MKYVTILITLDKRKPNNYKLTVFQQLRAEIKTFAPSEKAKWHKANVQVLPLSATFHIGVLCDLGRSRLGGLMYIRRQLSKL